ncbi:unnamed protein product [Closterium sp. NIES-53]
MGSLPCVVCEFCNRWFPNAQVYGGHKSRRTPCQGLSAVARPTRSAPTAGLHALLFVHDILSDAPAAPDSPTASNASNAVSVSGPPRVPEAHVDETPNDVNEGPPEDEHQPQPGAPAADTSDHPESRPKGRLNCGWSVATFEIDSHPPQRLLFQNSAQAFAEMFGHPNNAPGFKLKARVDEDPDAGSL